MLENCKIKVFGLLKFLCGNGIIISFSFQNTNDMKKSAFICPLKLSLGFVIASSSSRP